MKFKSFRNCCDIAAISRAEVASRLEKKKTIKKCNLMVMKVALKSATKIAHVYGPLGYTINRA